MDSWEMNKRENRVAEEGDNLKNLKCSGLASGGGARSELEGSDIL